MPLKSNIKTAALTAQVNELFCMNPHPELQHYTEMTFDYMPSF
jgi:hypothetical protein